MAASEPEGPDLRQAARWLARQAFLAPTGLGVAVGAGLADAALVVARAGLIAGILNAVITEAARLEQLWPVLGALAAVIAARAVALWARAAGGAHAARRICTALRQQLYEHVVALGPAGLRERPSGGVATSLVEHVDALEGYYAGYLPQVVLAAIVPPLLIGVVLTQDLLAGGLLLLAAPLVPLFMALVGVGAEHRAQHQQRSLSRISAHFLDRLRGLKTLRLFRATEAAAEAIERAADTYRERSLAVLRLAFLSSAVLELISAVAMALVAIYVGFSLLGYLDFGPGKELGLFSGLLILLLAPEVFLPLRRLAQHYHDRATAMGAAEVIRDLLQHSSPAPQRPAPLGGPPARDPSTGLPAPEPVRVSAETLTVRPAQAEAPVLRGLDLHVAPGERVVVSGPSGAGKSTLLEVVAGFRAPEAGQMLVAGEAPPGRGGIAWMGQQPWLFLGTVRDNLRLADPEADEDRLRAALEVADLSDTVHALPEGLDAPLGEDGHGLSGGQARRLSLARAVLSGAPLVLLDEPVAGLHPASAQRVLEALRRVADRRRTVILVAHDPAIRGWGDRHLAIERGRCVEVSGA